MGPPFSYWAVRIIKGDGVPFPTSGAAAKRTTMTGTIITTNNAIPTHVDRLSPLMAATAAVTHVLTDSNNATTTINQESAPGRSRPAPIEAKPTPTTRSTIAKPAGTSETSAITTITRRNAKPVFAAATVSNSSVIRLHDCVIAERAASPARLLP